MKTYSQLLKQNSKKQKKPSVVTIGNFDGLHKGHLALIKEVCRLKEKYGLYSAVFTFSVNTKLSKSLIFPQNQLKTYLNDFSPDYFICPDFIGEIKDLTCEEFAKKYLCELLNAKYVVVGEDFFFGKNKSGNVAALKELGKLYGFEVIPIKLKTVKNEILSSTLLREYIREGKISEANKLMYRNFSFFGRVKKGYKIGSSVIKIPTANTTLPKNCVELKNGVYITKTTVDEKTYESITNVGTNPTAPKKNVTVETNIFGFSGNIYKKRIKIEFLKYIRNETAFKSKSELKKQIEKDIKKAEKYFRGERCEAD